jgi:hypothetical protein
MTVLPFLDNLSFFVNKTNSATKGTTTGHLLSLEIRHVIDLSPASLSIFLALFSRATRSDERRAGYRGALSFRITAHGKSVSTPIPATIIFNLVSRYLSSIEGAE